MLRHDSKSYNSTTGGNLRFVGHGKIRMSGRGRKGFPVLLQGDDPIFHLLFWEITLFLSERGEAPETFGKYLRFLLVLVNLVGSPTCSSILFSFYSMLGCRVCFQKTSVTTHNYDPKAGEISWRYLLTDYWGKFRAHVANICGEINTSKPVY